METTGLKNYLNYKRKRTKKKKQKGLFYKTEIIIHPETHKSIKLVWDYFDRFPTEKEIEETRQYVLKGRIS